LYTVPKKENLYTVPKTECHYMATVSFKQGSLQQMPKAHISDCE